MSKVYTKLRHLYTPHYFICIHQITLSVYTTLRHLYTPYYVICIHHITSSAYTKLCQKYTPNYVIFIHRITSSGYIKLRHLYTPHYFICIRHITSYTYTTIRHLNTPHYAIRTFHITLSAYSILLLLYTYRKTSPVQANTTTLHQCTTHYVTCIHDKFPGAISCSLIHPYWGQIFYFQVLIMFSLTPRCNADTGRGLPHCLHRMQGTNLQVHYDLTLPHNLQEIIKKSTCH